jgi:hypothetical protein
LNDVVGNAELVRRPSRPPDHEAENNALIALAQTMADAPEMILQKLAETALQLCQADSAGIGLLKERNGVEVFSWEVFVGRSDDRPNEPITADATLCRPSTHNNTVYRAEEKTLLIPFDVITNRSASFASSPTMQTAILTGKMSDRQRLFTRICRPYYGRQGGRAAVRTEHQPEPVAVRMKIAVQIGEVNARRSAPTIKQ